MFETSSMSEAGVIQARIGKGLESDWEILGCLMVKVHR